MVLESGDAKDPPCDATIPLPETSLYIHNQHTSLDASEQIRGFRLGIRAHDLGRFPAGELAHRVSSYGLECVQLALGKAISGVDLRSGIIPAALAGEIGAAFVRHQVGIEVLGCYINPIHPDPVERRILLAWFKEHLRHAREFGCNLVALESGSLNPDYSSHPGNAGEDAYQQFLASMRELVAEAESCGVVVGIEAVTSHVISTPEKMRRFLDDIPSPHLQVVFDPVNLLSVENCLNQRDIVQRSLDSFGGRIAVVHAKDFQLADGLLAFCPAGSGLMEYGLLLSWLERHRPGIAVLLEETGPDDVAASGAFIKQQLFFPIP